MASCGGESGWFWSTPGVAVLHSLLRDAAGEGALGAVRGLWGFMAVVRAALPGPALDGGRAGPAPAPRRTAADGALRRGAGVPVGVRFSDPDMPMKNRLFVFPNTFFCKLIRRPPHSPVRPGRRRRQRRTMCRAGALRRRRCPPRAGVRGAPRRSGGACRLPGVLAGGGSRRGPDAKKPLPAFRPEGASSCGAPEGIRTPNLLIRSQMLYPLSYRRIGFRASPPFKPGSTLHAGPGSAKSAPSSRRGTARP